MSTGYIYRITNTLTGDFYIGKTITSVNKRWTRHKHDAMKKNSHHHFHRAIRKYGVESFLVEVLETSPASTISEREIHWIAELKPAYNMTMGGDGLLGWKHTEESRRRMSIAQTNRETLPLSQEHREAISRALKGNPNAREWKVGRKHSSETRKKMSVAHRGKPKSDAHKEKLTEHCRKMASTAAKIRWSKVRKAQQK